MRVLEPVAVAHGAELVDVEFRPESQGWVLRVFVEKAGASEHNLSTRDAAVSLELCANVSRDLSPALDIADLIPHAYRLEVSSPGIERPLRAEHDFVRFSGQKVRIKRRLPGGGSTQGRTITGILKGLSDRSSESSQMEKQVRVAEGTRVHDIPLSSIESARLVFEFGSTPRETQQRKH